MLHSLITLLQDCFNYFPIDSDDSYYEDRDERKHSRHRSSEPYPSSGVWFNDRIPYHHQPHPNAAQMSWPSPLQQYHPGMIPPTAAGYDPRLMHATGIPPPGIPITSTPVAQGVPQGPAVGPQAQENPVANSISQSLPNLSIATHQQSSPMQAVETRTPQRSPQYQQQNKSHRSAGTDQRQQVLQTVNKKYTSCIFDVR